MRYIKNLIVILLLNICLNLNSMNEYNNLSSDNNSFNYYKSNFKVPNETANKVLYDGQILDANETPEQMVERVISVIGLSEDIYPELQLKNHISNIDFMRQLGILIDEKIIVFSTPILTNAGRFKKRPLSACAMPPVDLNGDLNEVKRIVDQYHQDGMGTGFYLSEAKDPIRVLKYLNNIAKKGSNSNKEQRPVGNMAILDVDSAFIEKFIDIKVDADEHNEDWKFNLSVNISDSFIQAVESGQDIKLDDGKLINAKYLFKKIASAAYKCGDPGLIFLDRLNKDNPTPSLGAYKCTAPCAEVGLAPGETCVFGYINLNKLIINSDLGCKFDFDKLKYVVALLTRALDNILHVSIEQYLIDQSKNIMKAKRKIGIGICGFADLLISLNLLYSQKESRDILQDILNVISYHSKLASFELAKERGSFTALEQSRYMQESFIMDKYGQLNTPHVSRNQWNDLAKNIKQFKLLRNSTTTALPPTGRSALIIGASTGIEPLFSLNTPDGIYEPLQVFLSKRFPIDINKNMSEVLSSIEHPFVTSIELSADEHLDMLIAAQLATDEAISKTINLPESVTPEEIMNIYLKAYYAYLKGISIYRENSRSFQPKEL